MPLKKGYSKKTISYNIAVEKKHGKSSKVAAAIAFDIARKARKKAGKAPLKRLSKPKKRK